MKVPFLDLKAQYNSIKEEIDSKLLEVAASTAYASGPYVEEFEENFAKIHDAKYCVGVNSGTSALHLALLAGGIGKGDEVILPAHTFVATAWAVNYVGATPVFVDIDPETYTMQAISVEAKINDNTKALIPVHLYGQPADFDSIYEIEGTHELFMVEDAAQSHIAEYKGNRVGAFGQISCFSFYPGKNLGAYGEAGAIVTNNKELAEKCRLLRNHSQPEKYIHTDIGYNYRMDGMQGAVLNVKLNYIEEWTDRRIQIAEKYTEAFENISRVSAPKKLTYNIKHVYHLYELKLESMEIRNDLMNYLKSKDIHTGLHYPIPVHLQPAYKYLGYKRGDFPNTEEAADTLLSLPIYPEMTDEMVEYVIDEIKGYFE